MIERNPKEKERECPDKKTRNVSEATAPSRSTSPPYRQAVRPYLAFAPAISISSRECLRVVVASYPKVYRAQQKNAKKKRTSLFTSMAHYIFNQRMQYCLSSLLENLPTKLMADADFSNHFTSKGAIDRGTNAIRIISRFTCPE